MPMDLKAKSEKELNDMLIKLASSIKDEDLSDPETFALVSQLISILDKKPEPLPDDLVEQLKSIQDKAQRFRQAAQTLGVVSPDTMEKLKDSMKAAGLLKTESKSLISNKELIDHIADHTDGADKEMIGEFISGGHAHPVHLPVSDIKAGPKEQHIQSPSKTKRYTKMPSHSSPAIVVDEEHRIIDGHHRWNAAKKRGDSHVHSYKVCYGDCDKGLKKSESLHYKTGDRVVHPKHGPGTVRLNHGDGTLTVGFDSGGFSLNYKGDKIHHTELVQKPKAPTPNIKKSDLEKGSLQSRLPFNPKSKENAEVSRKQYLWTSEGDQETRDTLPRMEGPARVRALNRLAGKTQTKLHPKTGERLFLLHRGMGEDEYQTRHDHEFKTTNYPKDGSRTSWTPNHFIARGFANDNVGMNMPARSVSAWVPESAIHHVPNQFNAPDRFDEQRNSNETSEDEVIVDHSHGVHFDHADDQINEQKFKDKHVRVGIDQPTIAVAGQIKGRKKLQNPDDRTRMMHENINMRPKIIEAAKKKLKELNKSINGDWKDDKKYKFKHREFSGGRGQSIRVYHGSKRVGHLAFSSHARSDGYHEVYNAEIHPDHRGKGIYQEMIRQAGEKVVERGSKGVKSEGYQRSGDATRVWDKVATHANPFTSNARISNKNSQRDSDYYYTPELKKGQNGDWKKEGYTISHERDKHGVHRISARDSKGNEVATSRFWEDHGIKGRETDLYVSDSWVHKDHRRKGLASAMYSLAKEKSGKDLVEGITQSKDAQSLWSSFKKSESLTKAYPVNMNHSHIVLFPASIRGVEKDPHNPELPKYHVTLKWLGEKGPNPDGTEHHVQSIVDHHQITNPDVNDIKIRPHKFIAKDGMEHHVLLLDGMNPKLKSAAGELDHHNPSPYPFTPHITVSKELHDEVAAKGLTAKDIGLKIHPLEYRIGDKPIKRFDKPQASTPVIPDDLKRSADQALLKSMIDLLKPFKD